MESLPGCFVAGGDEGGSGAVASDVTGGKGSAWLLFFAGGGGKI